MIQAKIFEFDEPPLSATDIIIRAPQKNLLSKQQQAFNRLVGKIEKLKLRLEETTKALNERLDFYGKKIHPVEQRRNLLNIEITKLLFRFFKNKKLLLKKERQSLKAILANQLNLISPFLESEPDEELESIFKAIEGLSYEEARDEEYDLMMNDLQDVFDDFGFDLDIDDFHRKMTSTDFIEKMMEAEGQMKENNQKNDFKRPERKKTKKQLEKEERVKKIEEARTKNISSIYRQLAKIFHPDLERDQDMKIEKEELMKKLTVAYQNSDLHTLLSLELAWIQKEENNLGKLTDDKLSIYNEVLREQVRDLENQIYMEINHPRYQPLHRFAPFGDIQNINLSHEWYKMTETMKSLELDIAELNGDEKQSLITAKKIIREFQNMEIYRNRFNRYIK